MYRMRRVLPFMREHKIVTGFLGTTLGSAVMNVGLIGLGATIGLLAALWGILGVLRLFSGFTGSTHLPGLERINGVSYMANSPEAISARSSARY